MNVDYEFYFDIMTRQKPHYQDSWINTWTKSGHRPKRWRIQDFSCWGGGGWQPNIWPIFHKNYMKMNERIVPGWGKWRPLCPLKSVNAKSKDNLLKLQTRSHGHGLVCSIVKEVNQHKRSDFLVEAERLCIHTISAGSVSLSPHPSPRSVMITTPWVQDLSPNTGDYNPVGATLQRCGCRTCLPIHEITILWV